MHKIVEHFYSIQGEGSWAGMPATFIRFYGCDLACHFCDEPLHKDTKNITLMDNEAILALCDKSDRVVITGGEPSLNDLNNLIQYLQINNKKVAVETNGYSYYNVYTANLVTLSPKASNKRPDGVWDDIKLLVNEANELSIEDEIKYWRAMGGRVFLSAINFQTELDNSNNSKTVELCLKHNVTISVQLHKVLGVQ